MTDQPPTQPPAPPAPPGSDYPPGGAAAPGPGRAPGGPYPPAAGPKTSGLAVASLVLGISGLCTCGVTSLVGLVLGIVALRRIGESAGTLTGKGVGIAGIIWSCASLLIGLALIVGSVAFFFFAERRVVEMGREFRHYEVQQALETTASALELYRMDAGHYPTEAEGGLEALVRRPPGVPEDAWNGPYLGEIPVDRWGSPLVYEPPDPTGRDLAAVAYHLWSLGPDGVPDTPDDIERQ